MDWTSFSITLEEKYKEFGHIIPQYWNETEIEGETSLLYELINETLDEHAPKEKIFPRVRPTWWTEEISKKSNKVKKVFKILKKHRNYISQQRWDEYREMKNNLNKDIRKSKRKSYQQYLSEITDFKGTARLMKQMQKVPQAKLGILKKEDGKFTESIEESMDLLMDTHFPESQDLDLSLATNNEFLDQTIIEDLSWITPDLTRSAINTFGSQKAAGSDTLKPIILQNLPDNIINWITKIFTACIQLSYTPAEWRKSKVIFLPKPNKNDYSNPRSFRPISLTSFLFKTLERLTYWELERTTLITNPLHNNQHAFRKGGFCTETILSGVVNNIEKAFHDKNIVLMTFLDIKGAFDNISLESAIKSMATHNFPENIRNWYKHYLENRSGYTETNGTTLIRQLIRGTPQGGILSPLLWNMCADTLLHKFNNTNITAQGYADDTSLAITGKVKNIDTIINQMQGAIDTALNWGHANGLNFSPEKTVAMLFTRNYKIKPTTHLKVGSYQVPYSKSAKYLGVTITSNLNWTPHIVDKINQGKKTLHRVNSSIGKLWGPSPALMRWSYTGIVRPRITYGSFIWAQGAQKLHVKQKFKKLQRLACLPVTHLRHSTPTAGLEVTLNLTPLEFYIKELAIKTYLRIHEKLETNWSGETRTLDKGHIKWCKTFADDIGINLTDNDMICRTLNTINKFTVNKDSFNHGNDISSHGTKCYTDGSKGAIGSGSGYVIYSHSNNPVKTCSISLNSYNTVFQAEVFAISEASRIMLNMIITKTLITEKINILSDSQATLHSLTSLDVRSRTVSDCIKHLNALAEQVSVELFYIKAHVGHQGNEQADQLAKHAAENMNLKILQEPNYNPSDGEQISSLPTPKCHIYNQIESLHYKTME